MTLPDAKGAYFAVHVKPNSLRTEYLGYDEERSAHQFSVAAVADGGKANAALLSYLKKELRIVCEICSGHTARKKLLRVVEKR